MTRCHDDNITRWQDGRRFTWEPTLPAERDLGHRSQSPVHQVQNLGGGRKLLDKACPTGQELGGGCQVCLNLKSLDCAKNLHLCIVAGLPVMGGLGGALVEMPGATLSWQPWWRLRGKGGRLNFFTSATFEIGHRDWLLRLKSWNPSDIWLLWCLDKKTKW